MYSNLQRKLSITSKNVKKKLRKINVIVVKNIIATRQLFVRRLKRKGKQKNNKEKVFICDLSILDNQVQTSKDYGLSIFGQHKKDDFGTVILDYQKIDTNGYFSVFVNLRNLI